MDTNLRLTLAYAGIEATNDEYYGDASASQQSLGRTNPLSSRFK